MRFLIALFLVTSSYATNLDSLLNRSSTGERNARSLQGFIVGKGVLVARYAPTLTPPEKLFNTGLRPLSIIPASPTLPAINNTEAEIRDLQISTAKMSVILENLQKQSDSHTDNINIIVKIFEILVGSITTIAVAVISTRGLRKKRD
jgi:hypothetical protein